MSTMVGVRGGSSVAMASDAESGAATAAVGGMREGIIQTPGPFYNGNPSSRIWGGPPPASFFRAPDPAPASPSSPPPRSSSSRGAPASSSYVTAPVSFAAGWGGGDRNGVVASTVASSSSSSSSSPFQSLFVPASYSSASSSFQSATSAFSSPAPLSSSFPTVAAGSLAASAAKAARRYSGRRDAGSAAPASLSTGAGSGAVPEAGNAKENFGARAGAGGPAVNAASKSVSGILKTGGKGASRSQPMDSYQHQDAGSGFRFGSGNLKSAFEFSSAGNGDTTFRFGSSKHSGEGVVGSGLRFGARVAKSGDDMTSTAGDVGESSVAQSFASLDLNSEETSVANGLTRLKLTSDKATAAATILAGEVSAPGFVFNSRKVKASPEPVSVGTTDPLAVPHSDLSGSKSKSTAGSQSISREPLAENVSFRFNYGSVLQPSQFSAGLGGFTAGEPMDMNGASVISHSRFRAENAAQLADAIHVGSNGKLVPDISPPFASAPKAQERLKQTSADYVSSDSKFLKATDGALPGVGGECQVLPSESEQNTSPALGGSVFSAPGAANVQPSSAPATDQGAPSIFVFGSAPTSGTGIEKNQTAFSFSRTRMKFKKGLLSPKEIGLSSPGASPPPAMADLFSSTLSNVSAESSSAGHVSGSAKFSEFAQAASTIYGMSRGQDIPSISSDSPVVSTAAETREPPSAERVGTANWDSFYAGLFNDFKHSFSLKDNQTTTVDEEEQSGAGKNLLFKFQVLGGSPHRATQVSDVNSEPFVFGAMKAAHCETQKIANAVKRKKWKPLQVYGSRKSGKSALLHSQQSPSPVSDSSPMDVSPREEEDMEDDALISLRHAASDLNIGKESGSEEVLPKQNFGSPKGEPESVNSVGEGGKPKKFSSDRGFVFSASPALSAPGVQRRQVRKTYHEKLPEMRKFVSMKSRTDSSSVAGDAKMDQAMADDLGARLHITGPEMSTTPSSPTAAVAVAAERACERWRLRGNEAYESGDFSKAEEYYSRGAGSVSSHLTSQSCVRALTLCYSNRAATRMAVGRMRDAIGDCIRAMAVDPSFLRVRLRLANCHLSLGETEAAAAAFKDCLKRVQDDDSLQDSKVAVEATEGLKKTQAMEDYADRALELLKNSSVPDTTTSLRFLTEGLKTSPHSEKLLELKAITLLLLRKYEDAVQLCEQTLSAAERNNPVSDSSKNNLDGLPVACPYNIWRWKVCAKSKFHLGELEEALEQLQIIEGHTSVIIDRPDYWQALDLRTADIPIINELLRHKAVGNEAFQAGKHAEAVEQYTAALACNGDSRPFSAVCFCNRAAASQALGHIADAIADCSRAISLDPTYAKAISRRATLHEMVRDYNQSVSDLQRLISLLESQQLHGKTGHGSSRVSKSNNIVQDLRQARERLSKAEEELRLRKKDHALDHYLILGVDKASTSGEIKKAYRKAALRHHPDKAGQFVVSNEGGDATLCREIRDEVRRDAERLFKLIGEANAVLSDVVKRAQYDKLEDVRKIGSQGNDMFGESARNRRHHHHSADRYDCWSGYGHQHQRWQSGPDAAQPDTYARRGRNGSHSTYSDGGVRRAEYDWDD